MAPNERGAAGNKDGTISVCNLESTLDIHVMASASSFFEHYGDFKLGATLNTVALPQLLTCY